MKYRRYPIYILLCLGAQILLAHRDNAIQPVDSVTTLEPMELDSDTHAVSGQMASSSSRPNDDSAEENAEEDACDDTLSSFARNFDLNPFLPDDFEEVSSTMHQIDLYNQVQHINDTIAIGERMYKYQQKLKNNGDITNTMYYLSSVFMDKIFSAGLSAQCSADLLKVMTAMRNYELWAMKCMYILGNLQNFSILTVLPC